MDTEKNDQASNGVDQSNKSVIDQMTLLRVQPVLWLKRP
jgi:hypothetical protein